MARRLSSFIDAFTEYASIYNTAPLYVKACALWMLGTAVTRQVGMRARGNSLHPNLILQMIGGPGTGKSQAVNATRSVFLPATGMSLIPASTTRAGLEDYMQQNLQQRVQPNGALLLSHECIALSEEMQGILPDQDLGHLTLYNILYDLPSIHKARTRGNGEISLEAPYCSILTGAQPAFLAVSMNEQAWGMGFMSRSIMVFDVPRERKSMFVFQDVDHKLKADLIHDLKEIHKLHGWMEWTSEAQALYHEWWVEEGGKPVPQAKRLAMGYNARRELHMAKLSMVYSLSRTNDLVVELEDVGNAIEALLHFEAQMRHIFAEMASTGSMVALQDVIDSVRVKTAAGEQMDESQMIDMLMQRFPSTQVHSLIENLIASGAVKISGGVNARGFRKFQIGDRVALG